MSLQLEENSISDCKMDISDATISVDNSAGVSPLAEDDDETETNTVEQSQSPVHHNHNNHAQMETIKHTQNEDDILKTSAHQLDNRIVRPKVLPLEAMPQRNSIARTLANSHPLMSPNATDSDSEQSHVQVPLALDIKCHNNFPDVVPNSERLLPSTPPSNVAVRNTLNNLHGKIVTAPSHNKLALLRTHSPDLLSSESDADVSQYHAAVEANFQAVALIPNVASSGAINKSNRRAKKHDGACCDDISSLDSISNHSFDDDEDIEHNLASLSPSSSLIDGLDDDNDNDDDDDDDEDDDDDCEGPELLPEVDDDNFFETTTPTPTARLSNQLPDELPQYSAAEERRDSRNWQKITLPDGRTREIDMRVIEPYKRVLSHGGYLKAGGHNAIVIFCACHLPDRSRADYNYVMDNLFLYVVKTLEQLVTEDYVLIYLHGGSNRRNFPPFPWLKKCYQLLDRRLRKSLKNMYLVHPTFWIKSIVWMARPFVSTKFWRKLVYVKSLAELGTHIAVEKAAIPEKVKQYDAKHN